MDRGHRLYRQEFSVEHRDSGSSSGSGSALQSENLGSFW